MITFAEWLQEHDVSMDNPVMPLLREAWFAGAKAYNPEHPAWSRSCSMCGQPVVQIDGLTPPPQNERKP